MSPARQGGIGPVAVALVTRAMSTRVQREGAIVRGEVRRLHHATAIWFNAG